MMNKDSKIYIAGHNGLVGSAIVRKLKQEGFENLLVRTREELDLLDQRAVDGFFAEEKPAYVILAAARVGGIKANMTYPAEFLYENLQIQNNVIWSALKHDTEKFLFLGSSCIYPKASPQPMKEEYFLDGKPEPTNEAYAIAKIAGMKLCEKINAEYGRNFISCMPTNIYGPGDNFDLDSSHVIPALMRRMHEAKMANTPEVVIWGSGESRREFLYVDDLADAVVWLMNNYDGKDFLNVGTGEDVSIKELAVLIKGITGFEGALVFDTTKPDGMPKKLLDVSKLETLGWKADTKLEQGLSSTHEHFTSTLG
ncbi:MAG: rmlD substrate binding domain protein [Parcubacteria group bacterium]|nr:rmlD substrate binding domain protein [Parcubacteria group bacterium]